MNQSRLALHQLLHHTPGTRGFRLAWQLPRLLWPGKFVLCLPSTSLIAILNLDPIIQIATLSGDTGRKWESGIGPACQDESGTLLYIFRGLLLPHRISSALPNSDGTQ